MRRSHFCSCLLGGFALICVSALWADDEKKPESPQSSIGKPTPSGATSKDRVPGSMLLPKWTEKIKAPVLEHVTLENAKKTVFNGTGRVAISCSIERARRT
jgi:hypothetical protein